MNKIAVVQREIEKDLFEVALGPIKMRVKRDELCRTAALRRVRPNGRPDPLAAARRQKNVHVTVTSAATDDMRMEINLIGRTVDEATGELEKYLTARSWPACPASASFMATAQASSAAASANS